MVNTLGVFSYGFGWNLGIAEVISAVIIIGFSIDYCLHLSHVYLEASEIGGVGFERRVFRVRYALEQMGTTIVGGATTTAGSGLVMILCLFMIFNKMATIIVLTIMFSFIFTIFFF